MKRFFAGLLAMLLLPPVFAAGVKASAARAAEASEAAGIVPRYLLMDANGRAVSNEDFPGYFQLITFGYTFCPDICPTTLAEMSAIMEKLGSASDRLQPLFITVDPERDTAAVLRNYTAFFHPRILGLTGSPALVRRAADNFKVRYEKARDPNASPDHYAVDHSAGMYLIGPGGEFLKKFAFATPPDEIAARIAEIMATTEVRPRQNPRRMP